MKKKVLKHLFIVILFLVFFLLLKKGFEDKVDPIWVEMEKISVNDSLTIPSQKVKLQKLFNKIHPKSNKDPLTLINSYNDIIRFKKFDSIVSRVFSEKKIIIFHSLGNGTTFITPKVAVFIAGSENRVARINCIVGQENKLHDKWIGAKTKDGFKPGKLLNFIETCRKNPTKKFVLSLDNIDNINRESLFGSELWQNLRSTLKKEPLKIEGYDKDLSIPNNLYIISTALKGELSRIPLDLHDYWKLAVKTPYRLKIDASELKGVLLKNKTNDLTLEENHKLVEQLYFFVKSNETIRNKVGINATVGQYAHSMIQNNNFDDAINFYLSNTSNFSNSANFSKKDFEPIYYSIKHNGKVKNSNTINQLAIKMTNLGFFSEFSVAILFALFSYIRFKQNNIKRKKNLYKILDEIKDTEKKYLLNKINYNNALGNLLSLKDNVDEMGENGNLNYTQILFLSEEIKQRTETVDFIQSLGQKSVKLKLFMKIVYADDDITTEEYKERMEFLRDSLHGIDEKTLSDVKHRLIKLHQKSNFKFGRKKI